jgi:hypothetical protein
VKLRVPDPCNLALEPQLGPLVLLEIAAVVAANALRAHHVQIQGDPSPDEFDEAAAARVIVARTYRMLRAIHAYRRRVLERLENDQAAWFADGDK